MKNKKNSREVKDMKNKIFKKVAAFGLALATTLSLGLINVAEVKAADADCVIKITNEDVGYTYTAYKIFSGTENGGKLDNVEWAANVNSAAQRAILTAAKSKIDNNITTSSTAAELAAVLDASNADKFAEIINDVITANTGITKTEESAPGTGENAGKYVINLSGDGAKIGYYFVKTTGVPTPSQQKTNVHGITYTKFMLQVVNGVVAVDVNHKADAPKIEKKIVENRQEVDANTAAIGDEVSYQIKSKVPDVKDYSKYYFIITDTLYKGLTFNEDSLKIEIKDNGTSKRVLSKDVDYSIETETLGNDDVQIKIVFKNAKDLFTYNENVNDVHIGNDIIVTYNATVNTSAIVGTSGNTNKVKLTYSHNPNISDNGVNEPEDYTPGEDHVTGETPEDVVITYVADLELLKINTSNAKLKNVKFNLTGNKLNLVQVKSNYKFEAAADGDYYELKDGTYTKTAPTNETKALYVNDGTTKYKLVNNTASSLIKWLSSTSIDAYTDAEGKIKFTGLNAGTYTLTETAPAGYKAIEPITVTISAKIGNDELGSKTIIDGTEQCTWNIAVSSSNSVAVDNSNRLLTITNTPVGDLPTTGGIGTTIFYVVGGILMLVSFVLLVVKKRMSKLS